MSFSRKTEAIFRSVAIIAALSLLLMPEHGISADKQCAVSQPPPLDCGACCESMSCCLQTPEQNELPAVPPISNHSGSEFTIALMAATRPLIWLIPVGVQDFVPHSSDRLALSVVALELLCIRLI